MENSQPPEHLLDDIDYQYVQASANVRFSNLLIDRLFLFGIWRLLLYFFEHSIGLFVYSAGDGETWAMFLVSYSLAATLYTAYYTLAEALTGGKSLGKLITRTRAVTAEGQRMSLQAAFLRSLCRLIPFEPFSAFGKPSYPWHDRFSKTLVIDETRTQLPPWD
jgi:uncharacterized RDD family membrane protein YckC